MKKTHLYIIAAGIGSRMNSNVPKALLEVSPGTKNYLNTINEFYDGVDYINVVVNEQMRDVWAIEQEYCANRYEKVRFIYIKSGKGDGHAVLRALVTSIYRDEDVGIVCWGDAVFTNGADLLKEMRAKNDAYFYGGIIPAHKEENPYVNLLVDDNSNCIGVQFSKLAEITHGTIGFHDQCIFMFASLGKLYDALYDLDRAYSRVAYSDDHGYRTANGELSLLLVFPFLYQQGDHFHVYETQFNVASFNTMQEFESACFSIVD